MQNSLGMCLSNKYSLLEENSGTSVNPGISYYNGGCNQSTYLPLVLRFDEYFKLNKNLVEFARYSYNKNLPLNSFIRNYLRQPNVMIIPMKYLVLDCDYYHILTHSTEELPSDQQIKHIQQYVYECCFISKVWALSSLVIRNILVEFFAETFVNEREHIDELLKQENTFVLMVINHTLRQSKEIEKEHIIAAIMYTTNQIDSICVDFVTTGRGYYSYGYGTLLLHMAQVFGEENIKHHTSSKNVSLLPNKMITYLCCRNDTKDYYIQLGFKVIPSDVLLQNENLISFGNRFKMKENLELDEKIV